MTMQDLTEYINEKIQSNPSQIVFTFYELRVKYSLSEEETNAVIILCKNKFKNLGYEVYLTGQKFTFMGENRIVESNELMIAIKG